MTTIERVFNECHEQIFNHALGAVKNIHDAEDIRSEVYVKIQRLNSAKFNELKQTSLSSWVHTITNSVITDYFRTNHQNHYKAVGDYVNNEGRELFTFVAPTQSNADNQVLTIELQKRITKAFKSLKQNYRMVAILYFIRGKEYSEIAEILNMPIGSVKGMLNRSREKLQETLKGVYKVRSVNVQA